MNGVGSPRPCAFTFKNKCLAYKIYSLFNLKFNVMKKSISYHWYTFVYVDKAGNELKREKFECSSKKEALFIARNKAAVSMINDLFKIKVLPKTKESS